MVLICRPGPGRPRTGEERAREAGTADYAAGLMWRSGRLTAARQLIARARALDPAQADLWARREAAITAAERAAQPPQPPAASHPGTPGRPARGRAATRPGMCPDCGTAQLTCGRAICQACGALRLLRGRDAGAEAGQ